MAVNSDMARLVRKLREQLGLTQEKFAAKLGVTFPTINRWENGRSRPSPLALQRLEELLREVGNKNLLKRYLLIANRRTSGATHQRR